MQDSLVNICYILSLILCDECLLKEMEKNGKSSFGKKRLVAPFLFGFLPYKTCRSLFMSGRQWINHDF